MRYELTDEKIAPLAAINSVIIVNPEFNVIISTEFASITASCLLISAPCRSGMARVSSEIQTAAAAAVAEFAGAQSFSKSSSDLNRYQMQCAEQGKDTVVRPGQGPL